MTPATPERLRERRRESQRINRKNEIANLLAELNQETMTQQRQRLSDQLKAVRASYGVLHK